MPADLCALVFGENKDLRRLLTFWPGQCQASTPVAIIRLGEPIVKQCLNSPERSAEIGDEKRKPRRNLICPRSGSLAVSYDHRNVLYPRFTFERTSQGSNKCPQPRLQHSALQGSRLRAKLPPDFC